MLINDIISHTLSNHANNICKALLKLKCVILQYKYCNCITNLMNKYCKQILQLHVTSVLIQCRSGTKTSHQNNKKSSSTPQPQFQSLTDTRLTTVLFASVVSMYPPFPQAHMCLKRSHFGEHFTKDTVAVSIAYKLCMYCKLYIAYYSLTTVNLVSIVLHWKSFAAFVPYSHRRYTVNDVCTPSIFLFSIFIYKEGNFHITVPSN